MHFARATVLLVGAALTLACAQAREPDVEGEVPTDASGVSAPIAFDVPEGARSVTIVVSGPGVLGLASLRMPDGSEQVRAADATSLAATYPGWLGSGATRQFPRRGTFVFQYPTLASQPLSAGGGSFRAATSIAGASVDAQVFVAVGPARTLHVSLVSLSAFSVAAEPAALTRARTILAPAGIELVVDEQIDLRDAGVLPTPMSIAEPDDPTVPFVREAQAALSTDALPIVFAELPERANGFSRGLPMPPIRGDAEHAVIVDPTIAWPGGGEIVVARVIAHELGHALGLPHPVDGTLMGDFDDPFDDTTRFDETLMGSADAGAPISEVELVLTPQQIFAMTRSALLR